LQKIVTVLAILIIDVHPCGMFSNQKSKFGKFFEGLAMKKVTAIWYILLPFGNK
jgi:hypothetical protein